MRVHAARRVIVLKVVYYGPGLGGKTTNLRQLHAELRGPARGELIQLDTEQERTLFFDYFPMDYGNLVGFGVKVDLFTVPGQSFYSDTRRIVLDGADGVVFVADSSASRETANQLSHDDMEAAFRASGRDPHSVPIVYQWNKRDVGNALPVALLERQLNPRGAPSIEAVATRGQGVLQTSKLILAEVTTAIQRRVGGAANPGEARDVR